MNKINRRKFTRLAASGLAGFSGVGFYTWQIEPHWVEFTQRLLPLKNLPKSLNDTTLIQLSDLHIGPRVDSNYIIQTLQKVAALKPQLVLISGDFISYDGDWVLDELSRVLKLIPRLGQAVYACLGNHDYGADWSDLMVAERVRTILNKSGIKVLNNQIDLFSGLQIVGLDDFWGPNFDPSVVLPSLNPNAPRICLCHNPDALDHKGLSDYQGWVLAGHTHGGQCKPPFLNPPILPVKNALYTAGEIEISRGRKLYINRGLGHLLKVRFNVRPEVTVFTLKSA